MAESTLNQDLCEESMVVAGESTLNNDCLDKSTVTASDIGRESTLGGDCRCQLTYGLPDDAYVRTVD